MTFRNNDSINFVYCSCFIQSFTTTTTTLTFSSQRYVHHPIGLQWSSSSSITTSLSIHFFDLLNHRRIVKVRCRSRIVGQFRHQLHRRQEGSDQGARCFVGTKKDKATNGNPQDARLQAMPQGLGSIDVHRTVPDIAYAAIGNAVAIDAQLYQK